MKTPLQTIEDDRRKFEEKFCIDGILGKEITPIITHSQTKSDPMLTSNGILRKEIKKHITTSTLALLDSLIVMLKETHEVESCDMHGHLDKEETIQSLETLKANIKE